MAEEAVVAAEKATSFEIAIQNFFQRTAYRSRSSRGYATEGTHFWLNGHEIAEWHEGAVRMFLNDPQWHKQMVAQAIRRVRVAARELGYLAERSEVICKEHVDCFANPELGKACARDRFGPKTRPLPLPYFEKQVAMRKAKERTRERSRAGARAWERGVEQMKVEQMKMGGRP